jgi:competence protein ComEC
MQTTEGTPRSKFERAVTTLPLTWLSLAFLAGILASNRLALPPAAWWIPAGVLLLAGAALFFLKALRRRFERLPFRTILLVLVGLVAFLLGGLRHQLSVPQLDRGQIAWYNDRQYDLLITGTVDALPDVRDTYTNLRLRVRAVDTGSGDVEVKGLLLVRLEGDEVYHYGEVLRLRGRLSTPPENDEFSYRDYLARQGIHAYMPAATVTRLPLARGGNPFLRWVFDLKEKALATLYVIFPDPEASLLAGILLGEDNGMPAELQQAFRDTGTAHIIAISGFNMTILAALFMLVFQRLLGMKRGAWVAVAGITLYTLLVGAQAAVVRAAIMGALGIFARQMGRRQTALNSLAFTAALMSAFDPSMPWDVGFQLSCAAVLGLVLYAQPLQDWSVRLLARFTLPATAARLARPLGEYFFFTLAAQLTTLPILVVHFARFSLVSLVANPFILPAQPLVMILGGVALLSGLIFLPLGRVLAWAALPFSAYTIRAVELFDRLPHGLLVVGDFSVLFALAYYALLFLFTLSQGKARQVLRPLLKPTVLLSVLGILAYTTWRAALLAPDGRLHITFLDVGSAEAVFIETPGGRSLLINGGPSPSALADSLGRRLSPFDRSLDWLIVAAPQEEQLAALPRLLERFPPRNALWSGNLQASYSALRVDEWLTQTGVPLVRAAPGWALDLGSGARLEVLSSTERGAVLLVEWGQFRALLPVGLNFESLVELGYGETIGAVDVLLLADSGYAPLNQAEWIANLSPQVFILSVAAGDDSGLPDEAVLALTEGGSLMRTDRNGWIEVITDGEQFRVEVERK